jgi:hypothetical protein
MGHWKALLLLTIAVAALSGCRHPLEIYGEGDIYSSSGTRDCTLEQFRAADSQCTTNWAQDKPNDETYTAKPRPGWVFKGWRTYCANNNFSDTCSFGSNSISRANKDWGPNSASRVQEDLDSTFYPLKAEFVRDCTDDPTCTVSIVPILGAVTDTSIKIWGATLSDSVFKVHYRIPEDTSWSADYAVALDAASGFAGTVELTGLNPSTAYEYEVLYNDVTPPNGTGTFSTLPTQGFAGKLRFGMATDFLYYEQPFLTLGQAATKNFDFMLMNGDLMYSDFSPAVPNDVSAYRTRYWNTWDGPNFSALSTTTPMFMIWDDHEIINDFWPGKYAENRYPAARAAYNSHVHSHNPDTAPDPTPPSGSSGDVLYYSFSAPGADFFVLDTRSYRSPGTAVDDEDKTMLGDVQLNALLDHLETQQSKSLDTFKFIVTSVPFALGAAAADTWSGYRTEREFILSEIERRGIVSVVFLSGDRHYSGIYRIISPGGYVYYDFMPSPTGAFFLLVPVGNPHPEQEEIVYTTTFSQMFGDFQIDLSETTPTLRAAFVDENGIDQCVITIGNDETGVLAGLPLAACEPPPGCF